MDHQAKKGRPTTTRAAALEVREQAGAALSAFLSKSKANVLKRIERNKKAAALAGPPGPDWHHPARDVRAERALITVDHATVGPNREERREPRSRPRTDRRWVAPTDDMPGRYVWPTPPSQNRPYEPSRPSVAGDHT